MIADRWDAYLHGSMEGMNEKMAGIKPSTGYWGGMHISPSQAVVSTCTQRYEDQDQMYGFPWYLQNTELIFRT